MNKGTVSPTVGILVIVVLLIIGGIAYFAMYRPLSPQAQIPAPTPTDQATTTTPVLTQGVFGAVIACSGTQARRPSGTIVGGCGPSKGASVTVSFAGEIVGKYTTDQTGMYKIELQPGNYIVCVPGSDCSGGVTVKTGQLTQVENLTIQYQ